MTPHGPSAEAPASHSCLPGFPLTHPSLPLIPNVMPLCSADSVPLSHFPDGTSVEAAPLFCSGFSGILAVRLGILGAALEPGSPLYGPAPTAHGFCPEPLITNKYVTA